MRWQVLQENPSSPFAPDEAPYEPIEFDPERTSADGEPPFEPAPDLETVALRDAMRDIIAAEGRFEVLLF